MNYAKYLQEGLRLSIKLILKDIEKNGIGNNQKIYITFDTQDKKVILPEYLRNQYPENMIILLENEEYENLIVTEKYFEVDLFFDTKQDTIKVPFNKILKFEDPKEILCLDFFAEQEEKIKPKKFKEDNIIDINSLKKN